MTAPNEPEFRMRAWSMAQLHALIDPLVRPDSFDSEQHAAEKAAMAEVLRRCAQVEELQAARAERDRCATEVKILVARIRRQRTHVAALCATAQVLRAALVVADKGEHTHAFDCPHARNPSDLCDCRPEAEVARTDANRALVDAALARQGAHALEEIVGLVGAAEDRATGDPRAVGCLMTGHNFRPNEAWCTLCGSHRAAIDGAWNQALERVAGFAQSRITPPHQGGGTAIESSNGTARSIVNEARSLKRLLHPERGI